MHTVARYCARASQDAGIAGSVVAPGQPADGEAFFFNSAPGQSRSPRSLRSRSPGSRPGTWLMSAFRQLVVRTNNDPLS
jgi:hypothetical protein